MENTTKKWLWGIILIGLLPILYFFQQYLQYEKEELYKVRGVYQRMELKQDRIYRLKLHLKNDPNVYVLDKVSYRAWKKYPFLNQIKRGDSLNIEIKKSKAALCEDKEADFIYAVTIGNQKRDFLSLEDYNIYQKVEFIKFYIFWGVAFMIFLYLNFLKKKTPKIEEVAESV